MICRVAGVNGVGMALLRHADDLGYVKIGPNGVAFLANLIRLVSLLAVHRPAIFPGENGDSLGPQLKSRPKSTDGNFTTVSDQNFFNLATGGHLNSYECLWSLKSISPKDRSTQCSFLWQIPEGAPRKYLPLLDYLLSFWL